MPGRNVGGIDRAARLAIGAVLLAIGLAQLVSGGGHGWTVTIIGALVLVTGVVGFCPPYVLLGISTARRKGSADPGGTAAAPR
jgi:DUF2892 family protein